MASEERHGLTTGPLMTVAEVADVLRVSSMTVYRLIKAGELPAIRVGKTYRIPERGLTRYLDDGAVRADPAEG